MPGFLDFEWQRHEKHTTLKSSEVYFKIKPENQDGDTHYEVFIADDRNRSDWRSLRLFTDVSDIRHVMRWVENIAQRIIEKRREERFESGDTA